MDNKVTNLAADNIRILAASMVEKANSGHPGGAMGGADFVNVLFSEYLVYDPENPRWEGRDRFFLDPGHMSPMLYSVLALTGNSRWKNFGYLRGNHCIRMCTNRMHRYLSPALLFGSKRNRIIHYTFVSLKYYISHHSHTKN